MPAPPPKPAPRPAAPPTAATPSAPDPDAQDLALVQSIRAGDPSAWSTLLVRYQDRLYGVCFRMVASREWAADLTQDAMVKIIQGLDSYDGRSKLSTWMIRVAMNVCLSSLRSEKHRRHASLDAAMERGASRDGQARSAGGPSSLRNSPKNRAPHGRQGLEAQREPAAHVSVEQQEERQLLAAALQRIDPEQRAMLVLRDVRGLEYDQIADILSVPVGTVKSRLFRARTALREALDNPGQTS